jgi:hypothetical protein
VAQVNEEKDYEGEIEESDRVAQDLVKKFDTLALHKGGDTD